MDDAISAGVPYELTVIGYDAGDSVVEAEVRSPLLDPDLHPGAVVQVKFLADVTANPKLRFTLHSFQIDSLVEYLRSQSRVRSVMETELARDRQNWRGGKQSADDGADLFKRVKVDHLASHPRECASEATLSRMRALMSADQFEKFVAAQDTPQTRSTFSIVLKCPWDREHNVVLRFRDGVFQAVAHE